MPPANEEKKTTGFTKIKPANLALTAKSPAVAPAAGKRRSSPRPILLWSGIGILLAFTAAVIFVLPRWVKTPTVAVQHEVQPREAPPASAERAPAPGESPWTRIQQAELRKETQEILARMLDAKKLLTDKGVTMWAEREFQQALKRAEKGDSHYSEQKYGQAHAEYTAAHGMLSKLVDRIEPLFKESMEKGNRALEAGDSAKAKAAFDTALTIDPIDRNARLGRRRADTLDEVLALIDKGDDLGETGRLEEAKASYEEALELDGHSTQAKEKVGFAEAQIADREFNRAMSAGFGFLDQDRLSDARKAFSEALRIRTGSPEALRGLEQADSRIKANRLHSLLAEAAQFEAQEEWHPAVSTYESALSLDASLSAAQQGRERASMRAAIHDRLEQILAQPRRVFDRDIYEETAEFHRKLSSISNPGPTLHRQLTNLARLLQKADTPVDVELVSDNLTKVTVYKVGELGAFLSKRLSLRPGRYVAVGQREGYQDVRREFFVDPDKPMESITIRANEKIALGN